MIRVSETRQLEMAIRFVLMGLREGQGQVPLLRRPVLRLAARLLHLDAVPDYWTAHKDFIPFLEAAGFDKDGHIIDYEKLYAYLDAHKSKKRKTLRSQHK